MIHGMNHTDLPIDALLADKIFDDFLKTAADQPVSFRLFQEIAGKYGYSPLTIQALFPQGMSSVLDVIQLWFDHKMMQQLNDVVVDEMRVRDRIAYATQIRFQILRPYKASLPKIMNVALGKISLCPSHFLWKSADQIWQWAGDTSQDYNYYTKRLLLSKLLLEVSLYFIQQTDDDIDDFHLFIDRRIDTILKWGRAISPLKPYLNVILRWVTPNASSESKAVHS
jgi:ubiquinone biosynthesis protein COQ9